MFVSVSGQRPPYVRKSPTEQQGRWVEGLGPVPFSALIPPGHSLGRGLTSLLLVGSL
jgi:hypothetical protein